MFKTQLLIFFRNLKRSGSISAVNILGLSVGIAAFILIFNFIQFETSYNRSIEGHERIYRMVWRYGVDKYSTRLQARVGEIAAQEISGVNAALRFFSQDGSINIEEEPGKAFFEEQILYTDQSVKQYLLSAKVSAERIKNQ